MNTIILITIVVIINVLLFVIYMRTHKQYQYKLAAVQGGTGNIYPQSVVDKPQLKVLVFMLAIICAEWQILTPLFDGLSSRGNIKSFISSITDKKNAEEPDILRSGSVLQNDTLKIKTSIIQNPDYNITISGYDVSEYKLNTNSTCYKELTNFAKQLDDFLLPIVDSDANLIITITGHADGIPCKKNAKYTDNMTVPVVEYYSLMSNKVVKKKFISNIALENEDFGRLRAYYTYELFFKNVQYPYTHYKLQSSTHQEIGNEVRKVDITIVVPNAFKERTKKYNKFQKKIFNFAINH